MSDRYIDFANSSLGHRLVAAIGLPSPVRLERWQAGRLRPVEGALLLGGGVPRLRAYAAGSGSTFHTGTPAMVSSPPKLLCTSTPTV